MKNSRSKGKLVLVLIMGMMLVGCSGLKDQTRITVNEAVHSAFYAPFYVAIENGYFKEAGLKIDLVTGSGSEQTKAALLAKECDIALMGSEVSVNVYNEGLEDYVINFAQLTQRAGDVLVSRVINENFAWSNLVGKTVIGSKPGSMPEMVFEYILKKQGLNPKSDVSIIQEVGSDQAAQVFSSGKGEYVILFEPEAAIMELQGEGKIVASLGRDSGKVPYTTFATRKSYSLENPEVLQAFTVAIQKGLDFVVSHTPEETAKVIEAQFPNADRDSLILILTDYYEQDTWKGNLIFDKRSYTLLLDLMEDSGELLKPVPYEEVVCTQFAQKAFEENNKK